jgi:Uma2 family endonuclease
LGEVRGSEFAVRLPKQRQRRLPDVSFVAASRAEIVLPNHFDAAPDLAMEVISPTSIARDRREKFNSYQAEGVKEYWIFDTKKSSMDAYRLGRGGKFRPIPESENGIASVVLPGFHLKSEWVFAQPRPSVLKILKELGIAGV